MKPIPLLKPRQALSRRTAFEDVAGLFFLFLISLIHARLEGQHCFITVLSATFLLCSRWVADH
jgi:hypothetical protein